MGNAARYRYRLRIVRVGPCEMLGVAFATSRCGRGERFDGREFGDKLVGCKEVEHGVGGVAAALFVRLSMFAPTSPNTPVIWLSMSGTLACSTKRRTRCPARGGGTHVAGGVVHRSLDAAVLQVIPSSAALP